MIAKKQRRIPATAAQIDEFVRLLLRVKQHLRSDQARFDDSWRYSLAERHAAGINLLIAFLDQLPHDE